MPAPTQLVGNPMVGMLPMYTKTFIKIQTLPICWKCQWLHKQITLSCYSDFSKRMNNLFGLFHIDPCTFSFSTRQEYPSQTECTLGSTTNRKKKGDHQPLKGNRLRFATLPEDQITAELFNWSGLEFPSRCHDGAIPISQPPFVTSASLDSHRLASGRQSRPWGGPIFLK